MEVALQINPVEDDYEADDVISLLNRKNLPPDWFVERPDDETKSVLIRQYRNKEFTTKEVERKFLFDNTADLLTYFEKKQIDHIKDLNLFVTIRVILEETAYLIPAALLGECGRLDIDIYVSNSSE
jgi:hypothetical protein